MDWTGYSDIISAVKDWFGLFALIILILAALCYQLTKGAKAEYRLAAFGLIAILLVPLLYIQIFADARGKTTPSNPQGPQINDNLHTQEEGRIGCGEVGGLRPATGDGYLSVRNAPGSQALEITRLFNGNGVSIYERSGNWLRIKFRRYDGRIVEGWSHRNWIVDAAC